MKVLVTNIEYDTDGEEIDLPTELTIEVDNGLTKDEIEEFVSDGISCITGYCHTGFSMDMPIMTSEEYLHNSNACPHCRSTNIVADSIESDGNYAWRVVSCEDCEKDWTENFSMTSMEINNE